MFRFFVILTGIITFFACKKEEQINKYILEEIVIPEGFPNITFPDDNTFTTQRWELGKKLFYDKRLSRDNSISCASCHKIEYSFSDNIPTSPGVENRQGSRNAPSLANVAYHPYFNKEGGVPTLEMQVQVPIQERNEFDHNILKIVDRLKSDSIYQSLSKEAYKREFDFYVLTRALADFERSLISGNSKYDQYLSNKTKLLSNEDRGRKLFFSDKTNCFKCHEGFNFTNYNFENNGLYDNYIDAGRYRLTEVETDKAKFKTPSLRNIKYSAPYMHDGSLKTLQEVLQHYNSGGKNHPNKSNLIKPLNLSPQELSDLEAFLLTLSDEEFVKNAFFK